MVDRGISEVPAGVQRRSWRWSVATNRLLGHDRRMDWIGEIFVQTLWEGLGEIAYRKWGWVGALSVLLAPIATIGLIFWAWLG